METETAPAPSPLGRLEERLAGYRPTTRVRERGSVVAVGDGVAWIRRLPSAALDDVIILEEGSRALVFHLGKELVGAILLQQTDRLTAGTGAQLSGAAPPSRLENNFWEGLWIPWAHHWTGWRRRATVRDGISSDHQHRFWPAPL